MNPPDTLLRLLLRVCVAFFLAMGTCHFFGIKVPVMFIYFDTPFYAYQDRIISFTLATYAALFLAASRHVAIVPYALVSIWATVAGLSYINASSELAGVLAEGNSTLVYWLQTGALGALALALTSLYVSRKKPS